jgi:hypothetical protein
MKALIVLLTTIMTTFNNSTYKIDFGTTQDGKDWMVVNDNVMGGRSNSTAELSTNSLIFKGFISLKNNGGFASLRSSLGSFDLSVFKKVKIRFRSAGRDFALRLGTSDLYYRPNYRHFFSSTTKDWEIAELNLSDFKEFTLGQITSTKISKDIFEKIIRIGIILNDKKEGPFEIEIDYIEFY